MRNSSRTAFDAGANAFVRKPSLRLIVVAALGAALLAFLFVRPPSIARGGIDFTAFYCGSRMLAAGENPYAYGPLRQCEHVSRQWNDRRDFVKAPLPPYALALLSPIAALPYPQAAFVWFVLLIASAAVMIWAIVELTRLPLLAVGIPVGVAVLLQSLPTGSLAPIPLALLTTAALALARRSWTVAALLLALACVEPHVAAPAVLAVFILVREMRLRLLAAVLGLVALSAAFGGLTLNVEYFTTVLPAHAVFELGSITQFSLSSMLHNFGVSDRLALTIGTVQYLSFAALGIWLASSFRAKNVAFVVLIPMALAITGGVYIHLTQIAAALPLALLVASQARSAVAWAGVALLTIPWNLLNVLTPMVVNVPSAAGVLSSTLAGHAAAGEVAYFANAMVYAAIACIFWGLTRRPRGLVAA